MGETFEVREIARVQTKPGDSENTAFLILEDTANNITGYAITPESLSVLLGQLLKLMPTWADHQDLKAETLVGPRHALSAQRMILMPGRHAAECAVRLYLGKIELTFLIPLDEALSATRNLREKLTVLNDESDSGFSH